jgi:hypothetical protein
MTGLSSRRNLMIGFGLLFVGIMGCAGDGQGPQQPTYPVTGEVKFDGKPVANATIVFHPLDKTNFKWDERPQAKSDAQGKFKVFTYKSDDGAPSADYKVGIVVYQEGSDEGDDQVKRVKGLIKLPTKYSSPETSGITAKVGKEATVLPTFELLSK